MRVLLIDNYDSFVYNLAQAFGALGADPVVVRNKASLDELEEVGADALVVSPGPGRPEEAGVSIAAIDRFAGRMPILGVCLGHQCIGVAFGGTVGRASVGPMHGKTSPIKHDDRGVFRDLPSPFIATHYHSLAIEEESWPAALGISARSDDGIVMGVRHNELPVDGVQFHPESVLTTDGPKLLQNFLETGP